MSIESIIALLASAGAVITGIITARSSATKSELESLRQTIDSLTRENARLQSRVQELEKRNELQDAAAGCLEDKVKMLEQERDALKEQVRLLSAENAQLRQRLDDLEQGKAGAD